MKPVKERLAEYKGRCKIVGKKEYKKLLRELDDKKYNEGFRYHVGYMDGSGTYFKDKPKETQLENAYMVRILIKW